MRLSFLTWKKQARILLAFFSFVLSISPASLALSAEISVFPLRVEFQAAKVGEALTLRNAGTSPVTIQPGVVKWTQKDGIDQLEPTKDVLVAPALVEIPPGESQIVRLALRRPADPAQELTYRLILREVPKPAAATGQQLQIVVNISLPIFVASVNPATPAKVEASLSSDGRSIAFSNPGNSHIQFKELSIRDAAGTAVNTASMFYLLGQQTRTMPLPPTPKLGAGPWQVNAKTDRGEISATATSTR